MSQAGPHRGGSGGCTAGVGNRPAMPPGQVVNGRPVNRGPVNGQPGKGGAGEQGTGYAAAMGPTRTVRICLASASTTSKRRPANSKASPAWGTWPASMLR